MTASANDQPNVRLAQTDVERAAASKLLFDSYGVDLLVHEQKSGAKAHFFLWPASDEPRAVAAIVVHRDGTSFVHLPAGDRTPTAVAELYRAIRQRANKLDARVVLQLLPPVLHGFGPELLEHGFVHVSNVLTMKCRDRQHVRNLGRLVPPPEQIEASEEGNERLSRLVQSTYTDSLSDPSLGPEHSAALFLERLKMESADHQDRFVQTHEGEDAAVCLISRYDNASQIGVRYLGVAPQFRGRKLGSRVLAGALAATWSSSYRCATVEVDEQNTYAINVYRELGFRTQSRATEFMLPLPGEE